MKRVAGLGIAVGDAGCCMRKHIGDADRDHSDTDADGIRADNPRDPHPDPRPDHASSVRWLHRRLGTHGPKPRRVLQLRLCVRGVGWPRDGLHVRGWDRHKLALFDCIAEQRLEARHRRDRDQWDGRLLGVLPTGETTMRIYMAPAGAIVNTGLVCSQEFKDDGVTDPANS